MFPHTEKSNTAARIACQLLMESLEKNDCKGNLVAIQHLSDLQYEVERYHIQGMLDEEFYQERLTVFAFSLPDDLPEAKSIIIVAYPHPQTRVTFTWKGRPVRRIIPPTYLYDGEGDLRIQKHVATTVEPFGYHVREAFLPKKLLAVCSGLGDYGKNNICYVGGMGSFIRLAAFYTDMPCPEDNWREPQMMDVCHKCAVCVDMCPSGAIAPDRFLLRAERCLTYHNEKPGDVPFPAWLNPSWHNSVVGCLICQKSCPVNADFVQRKEESTIFSEEETALLLKGGSSDQIPVDLANRLELFDLTDFLDILPRNLGVLLPR